MGRDFASISMDRVKARQRLQRALNRRGYELRRVQIGPEAPFGEHTRAVYREVRSYTMTPEIRVAALVEAIEYVVDRGIPGTVVECGVWRGGSMMAAALTL